MATKPEDRVTGGAAFGEAEMVFVWREVGGAKGARAAGLADLRACLTGCLTAPPSLPSAEPHSSGVSEVGHAHSLE